jgi:hypothetical protein
MRFWTWLFAFDPNLPDQPVAPHVSGWGRLDDLSRMRLSIASSLLLFALAFMLLIVAWLFRAWRRTVTRPFPPTRVEEDDAWARKPLVPPIDDDDEIEE